MVELIATIILVSSLVGIGVIIFRKIPLLVELPEAVSGGENFLMKLKRVIQKVNPIKNFSYEIFLQKILTKIRILSLKTDNKTFNWVQKLKEKHQKKKMENSANYWEEIKKEINKPE